MPGRAPGLAGLCAHGGLGGSRGHCAGRLGRRLLPSGPHAFGARTVRALRRAGARTRPGQARSLGAAHGGLERRVPVDGAQRGGDWLAGRRAVRAPIRTRAPPCSRTGWLPHLATRALGDPELAALHIARARELAEKLGAGRFVAQAFSNEARIALLRGDMERARLLVRRGWPAWARRGGVTPAQCCTGCLHAQPTAPRSDRRPCGRARRYSTRAHPATTTSTLPDSAIAALLEQGDWAGAERQCDRLERYCAREPLPWSDFVIARSRAFTRLGRGERDHALRETLERLRETAARAELNTALPALDAAIAAIPGAKGAAARSSRGPALDDSSPTSPLLLVAPSPSRNVVSQPRSRSPLSGSSRPKAVGRSPHGHLSDAHTASRDPAARSRIVRVKSNTRARCAVGSRVGDFS